MPGMIRIIIADDHKLFREGLKNLLERDRGIKVVAEAKSGHEVIALTARHQSDLIIMDITMPDMNGIEAARRIIAVAPDVNILMLSMHSHKRFVVETLKAGAKGYLLKECAFEELAAAIRQIMSGKIYLSAEIADVMLKDYVSRDTARDRSAFSVLSSREREILQLIVEGNNTKEIAAALELSVKTVETHRGKIMEKLNIRSIAELTKYAIREGLTTADK